MSRTAGPILKAYWESKSGPGLIPDRADIDPAEIRGVLPDLAMIERAGDGTYRIRLAGTRVSQRCGVEPTGIVFGEGHANEGLADLARLLDTCTVSGGPVESDIANFGSAPSFVRIEATVMPLRRGGDTIEMFILTLEFVVSSDQEFGARQYRNC
ncbi:MAG: PAS domain-containing protein [Minwuia sp.]|uniref:PAS domain-containing protein n=1 Tax=Minwuia sp. TaxID=2493630 RepID=UPI003A8C4892